MDWPHSPIHRLGDRGTYIVTSGTYQKEPIFRSSARLRFLQATLVQLCLKYGWALQAWAIFPNHYHFVAQSPSNVGTLRSLIRHIHSITAIEVNKQDATAGRRVWFEYWDSEITTERSLFARLSYVHHNAVHHGITRLAANYPYCSAAWFERTADKSFCKTVVNFPHSKTKVRDDYSVDSASVG